MRTLIVGDAIEIEGRTVAHIAASTMASHRDYLEGLIYAEEDDAAGSLDELQQACHELEGLVSNGTKALDDVISEGGSPIRALKALSAVIDEHIGRGAGDPLVEFYEMATEIVGLVDSVVAWIESEAKERDRVTAEVTAAARGDGPDGAYTDEQARAKLPVVEAALAHANERVSELAGRLAEHERDAEHARNAIKRITSAQGRDNVTRTAEIDALKKQNERQAAQIALLQAGGGHGQKAPQAVGQPKNQMGFDAAASRLYMHLQLQASKLDEPTRKLVAAVGRTLS